LSAPRSRTGSLVWASAAAAVAAAGLVLRARELTAHELWNDEAWVAIGTRVQGWEQFWLSAGPTPLGFHALLRGAAALGLAGAALRLVPFAFGAVTLVLAWLVGRRVAGHPLGGLLAVAALAFDPDAIAWTKQLKQYVAEACVALLAVHAAYRAADRRTPGALAWCVATVVVGVTLSNAQLVVGPVVLALLCADALVARDRRWIAATLAATAGTVVVVAVWAGLVIRPRRGAALEEYWRYAMVEGDVATATRATLSWVLEDLLPPVGGRGVRWAVLAMATLGPLALRRRAVHAAALAVTAVLVAAVVGHVLPAEARIALAFEVVLVVHAAAALGGALARIATWPAGRWLAPALAVGVLAVVVPPWRATPLGEIPFVEDTGRLVREMEAQRTDADGVLLHSGAAYVFAYYQRVTPAVIPVPGATTGFAPLFFPPVVVADTGGLATAVDGKLAGRRTVWFVGARHDEDNKREILDELRAIGRLDVREGTNGLVVRIER